ncbi:MAG: CinA family nicotinamide mononucleotide deamidase-related protein [Nitrospiraceae bacterium]|nr:CinA family nicotinamide mononucleotide deamidase-related protein [Nitrospiraceae bacterium]
MAMHGEIIAIGDELISGKVQNTTCGFVANRLFCSGYLINKITFIGDDPDAIRETILSAIGRSEYVIITGGLGPTSDDITNEAVAKALGHRLVLNKEIMEKIREAERHLVRPVPLWEKLAWLPEGAEALNPEGHSAGYLLIHQDVPLFFLPGVPEQLEDHMVHQVLPRLKVLVAQRMVVRQHTFKVFGLAETEINFLFKDLESSQDGLSIGYYPKFPEVNVTVTVKGLDPEGVNRIFDMACKTIEELLGRYIVAVNEDSLEGRVGRLLVKNGGVLAIAESCTGGLLGQRLTSIPGSSDWFDRGVISYSNRSKEELLGISHETLSRYGAVSYQTAKEMAEGIKRLADTSYGLAITGIAGPSGGTSQTPVGTVYIAMATPEKTAIERFHFPGMRHMVQALAAETALDWLRRYLDYGTYVPGYRSARHTK